MRGRRTAAAIAGLAVLAAACSAPGTSPTATAQFTTFEQVLDQAKGQTVNLYAYGGDQGANRYIDEVLAVKARGLGITVHRVPVDATTTAMQKLLGDKQAGKTSGGGVDLVWVNGENFRTGKQAALWDCGWTDLLPNGRYVNWADPEIANDFGTPVNKCEAPWSRAQFAFVYDSARVSQPPRTVPALLDWIRAHPGRFTYPAPPDFTGSVFTRQVFYATSGGYTTIPTGYDHDAYQRLSPALWSALRGIAPSLWRSGTTYPTSSAQLNTLYGNGEVDFTMTYGPAEIDALVANGTYPATTKAYTLDDGSIGNTAYLAIPANAANKAAAIAVANLELSPEQQLAKAQPTPWGVYPAIDLTRTDASWQQKFADLPRSAHVPPFAELSRHSLPELQANWTTPLDDGWRQEVLPR
ncbi:ABC transporter substrate-binding protein [Amycolatopsis sp. H20-H5]|uniref:ABC transporter substrate-binding protein n=1 Tax=Amycolatopsis sp. H20-H5 TaxID=3046309 RepID=UPI002DBDDB71|nr:ABC transporter substrate-binding protein [Amycolatopsis sp. H20-H5]MEC3975844.1 ABC transporter substrate-binding protein [Amycolatopsis sp. H20-H5]